MLGESVPFRLQRVKLTIPLVPKQLGYGNLGLCDDKRTLLDIVNEIGRRFDAPRATLYADVEATANQLRAEGATNLEPVNA